VYDLHGLALNLLDDKSFTVKNTKKWLQGVMDKQSGGYKIKSTDFDNGLDLMSTFAGLQLRIMLE
jgi:hypothetical protein